MQHTKHTSRLLQNASLEHTSQHRPSHMTPTTLRLHKRLGSRLKIIEGQVRGLQAMLAADRYCIDIITQTSAVRRALASIEDVLLTNHLNSCVVHQIKNGKEKTATKEIMKVYGLKRS